MTNPDAPVDSSRSLKSGALIVGLLLAGGYLAFSSFQEAAAGNVVQTPRLGVLSGVLGVVLVFIMNKLRWSRGWQFVGALGLLVVVSLGYALAWPHTRMPVPLIVLTGVLGSVVMFITAAVVSNFLRQEDLWLAVAVATVLCAAVLTQSGSRPTVALTIIAVAILARPART